MSSSLLPELPKLPTTLPAPPKLTAAPGSVSLPPPVNPVETPAAPSGFPNLPDLTQQALQALQNDPLLNQFKADTQAQLNSSLAQSQEAAQQALIRGGFQFNPQNLPQDLQDILTPEVLQLMQTAGGEGLTTSARLKRAQEDRQRAAINALASRGAHRSGELGFTVSRLAQQVKEEGFDARQKLLSYLGDLQRGVAEGRRAAQNAIAQFGRERASDLADFYANIGGLPGTQLPEPLAPIEAPPAFDFQKFIDAFSGSAPQPRINPATGLARGNVPGVSSEEQVKARLVPLGGGLNRDETTGRIYVIGGAGDLRLATEEEIAINRERGVAV